MEDLFDIPDFTGYKASKDGKIYSVIPKGCRDRFNKNKWVEPKPLTPRRTKTGYCRVYMRRDSTGIREDVYIHRIIASMFIPNPNNLPEVNHKDSNPENNQVENLEWISIIENRNYAFTSGNMARDEKGCFCHK